MAQLPLQPAAGLGEHPCVVITRVSSLPPLAWPTGWDDVEVVDSVLVEEPPDVAAPDAAAGAGAYDCFGRLPKLARYGRFVSVLA